MVFHLLIIYCGIITNHTTALKVTLINIIILNKTKIVF